MSEHVEIGVPGWRRGFWSLMATQFQTAFSDNALKNLVILLVLALVLVLGVQTLRVERLNHYAVPWLLHST